MWQTVQDHLTMYIEEIPLPSRELWDIMVPGNMHYRAVILVGTKVSLEV